jgi:general secretion pathway protein D
VATTIVGSNGKISAVGGLIRESQETRESGIPILKDIPWLGAFFKSMFVKRFEPNRIVLMRPYILSVPGEEETLSREMLDRLSAHPSAHDNFPSLGVGTEQFEAMPGSEIRP